MKAASNKSQVANMKAGPFFKKAEGKHSFFRIKQQPSSQNKDLKQAKGLQEEKLSSTKVKSDDNITSVLNKNAGKGKPLDSYPKSKMESAFRTRFDSINIHNDSKAAEMSEQLDAHAFTFGQDIYFNNGKYNPGSIEGNILLAHELAHTIQQKGNGISNRPAENLIEKEADNSAGRVVMNLNSLDSNKNGTEIRPKLKSGLRISRCSRSSSGPMGASRKATAITNFRAENSGLTITEKTKIETAMALVTAGNVNLEISFYDYYSNHSILKDPSIAGSELAFTNPNSDTKINPSVLDPSYPNNRLGNLLLHEFVHTRHNTNVMGTGDYQEGEAYATEYFFAERTGDTTRMGQIMALVSSSGTLTIPSLHASMQALFRKTYATLKILYEVIDTGATRHAASPLASPVLITRDRARELATELISVNVTSRSAQLNSIMTWAEANYRAIGIPPI